jgi:tetratricopeptide (TPR) repeat protein
VTRIYISSTFEDLKEYREAVYHALRRDRHDVISMEDMVAQGQKPLQACLEDVASCDIYIGIFAWRYGFIPPNEKDNPNKLSITELEYRKACEGKIPCLIFLLDEDTQWSPRFMDGTVQSGTNADNINRLRNGFKSDYVISRFKNKDELASLVLNAVHKVNQKPIEVTSAAAVSNNTSALSSLLLLQKPLTFKGEKSFFVGREEYINNLIKDQIQNPSSIVCIVGPGGSGKSQLAFKAIHQYEKEGLLDMVVPIYFSDVSLMSFSNFLLNIAKSFLDISDINEFEKLEIEQRKTVIYNFFAQRKRHPLLFLDNYETVSYILNDRNQQINSTEQYEEAVKISDYVNNELPPNISVLVTSRERRNNFRNKERRIDLVGLQEQECIALFSGLTSDDYLKNQENIISNPKAKSAIEKIFNMTGGHPLSIEIIAKNTSNIYEIQEMANTLGLGIINPDEPEQRLRSLEACFDYTISKLPDNIEKLLYLLTLFKSPLPIDVAKDVFNEEIKSVIELNKRSLIYEIKSETSFGEIKNPEYWLYSIHPAIRNYLEKTIEKTIKKNIFDLEKEYRINFCKCYYHLLHNIKNSLGKENIHRQSLARFNLIFNQGLENNDFDQAIKFAENNNDLLKCSSMCRTIGLILKDMGILTRALEYHFRSLGYNLRKNKSERISADYTSIGNMYLEMGYFAEALENHHKALEINMQSINMQSDEKKFRVAVNYNNIGQIYLNMTNYQKALDNLNKAREIKEKLSDKQSLAVTYDLIGQTHTKKDEFEQALDNLNKAREIKEKLSDKQSLADTYNNIGEVYNKKDCHKQALEFYDKGMEIYKQLNNKVEIARNHYQMSFPLYHMNKKDEALEHLSTAKTILLDFEKETGFSHPLLKKVENRLTELERDNES